MVSVIDATKPADGEAASKADLRANLATAKSEIEALQSNSISSINVDTFGADPTGVADSTAALQSAINVITSYGTDTGPNTITMNGRYLLNPATLDLSSVSRSNNVMLEFDGTLTLTSTFRYSGGFHIRGTAGAVDAQFGIKPKSYITYTGSATTPVINMVDDNGSCSLANVYVRPPTSHNAPAITLGYVNGDATQTQSALMFLDNVSVLSGNQANSTALTLENVFWVWIQDFAFNCQANSKASIHIADSYDPGANQNGSGLVQIENGVISTKGVLIEGDNVDIGHLVVKHVHYESCLNNFFTIDRPSTRRIWGFVVENLGFADNIVVDPAHFDIVNPGTVTDITILNMPNFTAARLFKGNAPDSCSINQVGRINVVGGSRNYLAPYARRGSYLIDGEQEVVSSFRGASWSSCAVPSDCTILPIDFDSSVWNLSGSPTVTAGQTAPDGSATAVLFSPTSAGVHTADIAPDQPNTIMAVGDRLLVGGWFKAESGRQIARFGAPFRISTTTGGTPWAEQSSSIFQPAFDRAQEASETWFPLSAFITLAAVTAGNYRFTLEGNNTVSGFYVWQPYWIVIPSSWEDRDVVRLREAISYVPEGAVTGVSTCLKYQPFKTGTSTTANRPSAVTAGKGAQFYDETLSQPIWSNGTIWTLADGTAA